MVDLVEDRPLGEVEGAVVVTLPGRRQTSASTSDLESGRCQTNLDIILWNTANMA